MESQKNITNSKNEIDNMVKEVTCVLRNHLVNLVKNNQDMSETMDILHGLPVIKNLQSENTDLKKKIVELNSEIAVLKNDLISSQKKEVLEVVTSLQLEVSEIKKITLNKPFIVGSVESEEDNILLQIPSQNDNLGYTFDNHSTTEDGFSTSEYNKNIEHIIVKKKDMGETNKSDVISTFEDKQDKLVKNIDEISLATNNEDSLDKDVDEDDSGKDLLKLKEKMIQERMKLDEDADDDGLVSEKDEEVEEGDDAEEVDEEEDDEEDDEEVDEEEDDEEVDEEEDNEEEDNEEEVEEEVEEGEEVEEEEDDEEEDAEDNEEVVESDDDIETEDDDSEEVEEWEFKGKKYYITGSENGCIFEYLENEEIGEEIGHIKNSKVFFS